MKKVGITGQSGFVGAHFASYVMDSEELELVPFEDCFFEDETRLRLFVKQCDVIVHLAAMSRCPSEDELYATNVGLVEKLIAAMEAETVTPHVMFSSSVHEERDTAYGRAKKEGRRLFEEWAERSGASFTGFIFVNVYGPGAKPFYCSFVANFCYQLNHGEEPKIQVDATMRMIYIKNLCRFVFSHVDDKGVSKMPVPWDFEKKVSEILEIFRGFQNGQLPDANDSNSGNLYETYISYRD